MNKLLMLLLLFSFSSFCEANLTLSAPPREKSAKEAESYYQPIADALTKFIGEKVEFKYAGNWINYAREMREGKYDVIFDGPQFVSWRIVHANHAPVAKLDGKLQFYVVVKKDHSKIKKMTDLLGKKLCGIPSPNLGTLAAFNLFGNPINQPNITPIKSAKGVWKSFLKGKCDAAVIRDAIYKKQPAEIKSQIKIIARSKLMPNQTVSVSKRVGDATLAKIAQFFVSEQGSLSADKLLTRFSKKKKYFVRAEVQEFDGLNDLLEGVVFGW